MHLDADQGRCIASRVACGQNPREPEWTEVASLVGKRLESERLACTGGRCAEPVRDRCGPSRS
jgi:hypothetical protein